MDGIKDKACLAGVGETAYTRNSGRSELSLACEAIKNALDDAGLTLADVDGIVKYTSDNVSEALLATTLGIPNLRYFCEIGYGGGGSGGTLVHAAIAVALGMAEVVVCFRALNFFSERVRPEDRKIDPKSPQNYGDPSFGWPWGFMVPAQLYSMQARRHMHEYGTTQEQFGWVAVTMRQHALNNPRAQMKGRPLTMEDYLKSRWIAEPFKLLDCCLQTDGAAAVIVTTPERARNLKHRPVYVMAGAQGTGPLPCAGHNRPSLTTFQGRYAAQELYRMAGIGPEDVDVALLYDHFTFFVLTSLESYGFCPIGEGGPFVENGGIELGHGRLPVNPHGGLLSEAYIHGMNHVVEGVRQLRGEAVNQVPDAEIALYCGAVMEPTSALILRR